MKRRTVGKRPVEATLRRDLDSLQEYTPIQLPGSLPDDGRGPGGRIVKADGNENVYGPSPRVLKALAAYDGYHIYPDPDQRLLRKALARYTGVAAEHIVAGAGSDEIIDLLLRLVVEPKDETITATPTFGMYTFSTQVCGGKPVEVPRTSDYHVDTQAVLGAVTKRTKAIFIASPNNPTGTLTSRKAVLELLESDLLVVIDEAYYEFCGETVADLVPKHENLVVLRTFSKWAGLAGLRVGYGLMAPALARKMMAIKTPYNVNAAAEVAALESLQDTVYLAGTVRKLVRERDRLVDELKQMDWLTPVPSAANFVLCHVRGRDAKTIQRTLRQRGIYIRYFDTPLLKNSIRISAGSPRDTDAIVQALREWKE